MVDLETIVTWQRNWSRRTFGEGRRTEGLCIHIEKELAEIRAKPQDLEEWIDVILLAMDGAWRAGYTAAQVAEALQAKQLKNHTRKWDVRGQDEPCEHVRGEK
jgi:hypothetical protein